MQSGDPGRPVTEWLIDHVPLSSGNRVLEIAAGIGTVTFAAAVRAPESSYVCTDVNVEAVAAAAHRGLLWSGERSGPQRVPSIAFLAADMRRLPFTRGAFDAALCRMGFMFAPDPAAALRETHRVLRPGGTLAFAVWGPPEENPWQSHLDEALSVVDVEDRSPQRRPGGMFGLADRTTVQQILEEVGFSILELTGIPLRRRYQGFEEYWTLEVEVGVERPRRLRALAPADLAAFRARLQTALRPYREKDDYLIPGLSLVAVARA